MSQHKVILAMFSIISLAGLSPFCLWAQSSQNADSSQSQSWTSTTNSQNSMGVNSIRTGETHTQSGNRTTDTQRLQRVGMDGQYEPYLDVEKDTVKVDANTVRTIQRSYAYTDGRRRLVQTTEEESRTLAGGEVKTVRTTSNPDTNGGMQVVQKEVEDTKKVSPGVQDTTTSVYTADINGALSESLRTQQRDTKTDEHTVHFQQTTSLKDGNGTWQINEVRQGVTKDNGKEQDREETVSQPDSDGKMAVVRRDVSKRTSDPSGETKTVEETESVDVPGIPREGALYPVQRITTNSKPGQGGGQTTQTTVQRPNPGAPTEGMQITVQTTDSVQPGPGGVMRSTRTIESFEDQNPAAVWVDFGQSNKPAVSTNTPTPAASKPQPKQ